MVTQGSAIQSYYHQEDSYAERPEDIPLSDLSHQSSLQSLTNHDDEDDDNSSVHSFELYTPDEEKSLLRKLDTRLVLFLALLYLLSFLDRSNIGNAKVAGLSTSLNLRPAQFEWLLTGFYISYICFEWMTLFEAAFGPGVPFYLSFFFKRNELAFRTGLFISAAPLASSFASTLAFAIVKLGKNTAIESWRILFIIEGFPSVLVAVWAWYVIPDSPSTAPWLSARERSIATLRLRKQMDTSQDDAFGNKQPKKFDWSAVRNTLRDPKSYLTAGCFFSLNVAFSSMPVFAPIIIQNMGYSAIKAQGLAAPPHLFAFVVVLVTSVISDRLQSRSIPIILHAISAMAGYLLLALAPALHLSSTAQYMCIFPITSGFFSAVTTVIVWTVNNQQSEEGRGSNVALLNVIGQLGPLLG
ncbi:MFS general substrate transporter, partial [Aureobasidium melanogenum]